MYPHMEHPNRVRNAISDPQVASSLQNLISIQHRQHIARIIETQAVVNVLDFSDKIFLK